MRALIAEWPSVATLQDIPGGAAGTRATLKAMARLARAAKTDIRIINTARGAVAGLPHKDFAAQVEACQRWVQRNIQFVRDVRGVETLTSPVMVLAQRAEDCDGQATLLAALLEAIGHPARFVAGGAGGDFVHVWCEALVGREWLAAETTEPWPLGRRPDFPCYMVEHL